MSRLIPGQKVALTDVIYRAQMKVSDWHWGVLIKRLGATKSVDFLTAEESGLTANDDQLLIDVKSIDISIEKIIVYAYTDAVDEHKREALGVELLANVSSEISHDIFLEKNSCSERALNLLEIYPYKDKWKVSCVCQGFAEGLDRFLAFYELNRPSNHNHANTSQSPTVDITKPIATPIPMMDHGDASIEMRWEMAEQSQNSPQKLYVGSEFNVISDFRIGCFYQLRNGQVGIAHSIEQSGLGSLIGVPYIKASRETEKHFEKLDINLNYQHKLHRYLIFAFMVEGYGNWKAHNMTISVNVDGVAPAVINPDSLMVKPVYAVAMLEFDQGNTELTLLNDYFDHLPALDHAYGWDLQWREAD